MVDITQKTVTTREALARGFILMKHETLERIINNDIVKGNVFEAARLAGILAAKKTSTLIPLCHPIPVTSIKLSFHPIKKKDMIQIDALVKSVGRTGVEMEALTAVCTAALTIYDMCKAIDRGMIIHKVELIKKSGGKSGTYIKRQANDKNGGASEENGPLAKQEGPA